MKVRFSMTDPQEVIDPYVGEVAACIARSRRIMVITGAGISCNSGIPDFRSSDGLYNLVKEKHPDAVLRGKELFDATLFKDENQTRCFYTFMAELKKLMSSAQPTPTHTFIHSMKEKGHLLRCYTQNIDCLEENLDLPVVQLHGTMNKVQCTLCSSKYDFSDDYQDQFLSGEPPCCPRCETNDNERQRLGKRSLAMGTLRPAVVLYNEEHPEGESIGQIQSADLRRRPDLLIVMGTSLKIPALKKYIKQVAKSIHANHPRTGRVIFINKTKPTKEWDTVFDYEVMSDTDEWVHRTEEKLADTKALAAARSRLAEALKCQLEKEAMEKEDKENIDTNIRKRKRTTVTITKITKTTTKKSSSSSSINNCTTPLRDSVLEKMKRTSKRKTPAK